ncbi:MAG TPA: hydrogenase maturation nickel metallochaperone HypA [Clostridia bacterium]|nr:hydrogenase maturation nickel metallochaperone HypA [Clostridia bacterium]
MHEYAVTRNIVDIAVKEAEAAGAGRILTIKLVIGDLASIIDESVSMYFDIISKDTIAEGAKLVFKRMPALFLCKSCGREFQKPRSGFDCPFCGGEGRLTDAGREFYIESLEVE